MGHPGFIGAVLLLAANDHLLKERYPGWWTGKLSDVAGVIVVGTLAAILLGRRRGLLITGGAFLLLKTTPGVAELASPVLGGGTSKDPSDLLALIVLVPLAHSLRASTVAGGDLSTHRTAPAPPSGRRRRHRAGTPAGVLIVLAIVAVATATATSCAPRSAVTYLTVRGQSIYALVTRGWSDPLWAVSQDGGRTWEESAPPPGAPSTTHVGRPGRTPGPTGPLASCASNGTCWQLRDQRVIERRSPGGDWVEEFQLSDEEFADLSTGCLGGDVGTLASLAIVNGPSGPDVVASLNAAGVLTRQRDGSWETTHVLSASIKEPRPIDRVAAFLVLVADALLMLTLWFVGRRRWPSWRAGLIVAFGGAATTIMLIGSIVFLGGPDLGPGVVGRVAVICTVVVMIMSVLVARRPVRTPAVELPPPPRGDVQP